MRHERLAVVPSAGVPAPTRRMGGLGTLFGAVLGAAVLVVIGYGAMAASSAPVAYATTTSAPTTAAPAVPDFGNPNGHFYVPPAGRAVSTRHPNHVIGTGSPASCTSAAMVRDVAAGGIITFN